MKPLCMRILPGFDIDTFPYLVLRDKENVLIVNVKAGTSFVAFKSPYQKLPFPQMLLDCNTNNLTGSILLYVLEYNETDSALAKYELTLDYIGALKMMASDNC